MQVGHAAAQVNFCAAVGRHDLVVAAAVHAHAHAHVERVSQSALRSAAPSACARLLHTLCAFSTISRDSGEPRRVARPSAAAGKRLLRGMRRVPPRDGDISGVSRQSAANHQCTAHGGRVCTCCTCIACVGAACVRGHSSRVSLAESLSAAPTPPPGQIRARGHARHSRTSTPRRTDETMHTGHK